MKVTVNAINRDKHINEASQQTVDDNLFKISCKCAKGMFSDWKICFNVFNIRTYVLEMCNLSKVNESIT